MRSISYKNTRMASCTTSSSCDTVREVAKRMSGNTQGRGLCSTTCHAWQKQGKVASHCAAGMMREELQHPEGMAAAAKLTVRLSRHWRSSCKGSQKESGGDWKACRKALLPSQGTGFGQLRFGSGWGESQQKPAVQARTGRQQHLVRYEKAQEKAISMCCVSACMRVCAQHCAASRSGLTGLWACVQALGPP